MMRNDRIGVAGALAGIVLGGLLAGAGCVGADEDQVGAGEEGSSGDTAELRSGWRFRRHQGARDAGGVAGVAGTTGSAGATGGGAAGTSGAVAPDGGPTVDCEICATAHQCCAVVENRSTCSFHVDDCAAMTGAARAAYVNGCLTYVVSVRGVWSGNPPAECR